MATQDIFQRYLDAGMAFTQVSREKAEEFVKDLVKAGEVRRKEAEEVVEALVERSRKNTEELIGIVRREVADQLRGLGLDDLVRRAGLPGSAGDKVEAAAVPSPAKATKKATESKPPAKKVAPAKAAAKKAPAASVTKAPAKKAPAKKAPAKKATKSAGSGPNS